MGMKAAWLPAFQCGPGRGNECLVYPLAGWIFCLALDSRRGWGLAGKVSSVLFFPQLPGHPSVHSSPVKPKAGNHSTIPLQNQDLSEHDRPAVLLWHAWRQSLLLTCLSLVG